MFEFENFSDAVEFMNFLAPRFDLVNHHPRWANEWRRVAIRLTTWAVGNKVTRVDLDVARQVEQWRRSSERCADLTGRDAQRTAGPQNDARRGDAYRTAVATDDRHQGCERRGPI